MARNVTLGMIDGRKRLQLNQCCSLPQRYASIGRSIVISEKGEESKYGDLFSAYWEKKEEGRSTAKQ